MKYIKTGTTRSDSKRNLLVMVDDEDYDVLSKYNWQVDKYNSVASHKTDKGRILIHRYIMNPSSTEEIDHIDGNRLNNQKSNLRICSSSQNKMNIGPRKDNKSGLKGVSLHKKTNKWGVRIMVEGKYKHIGLFLNKEDAAIAYNTEALKSFKEFAWLNKV